MSAYVDLYTALWHHAYGPERYAKRKDSPGQLSLFPHGGHDVSNQPREPDGRWTTGGNSAKDSPAPDDPTPKEATVRTEADRGSAGTEPKAEGGEMSVIPSRESWVKLTGSEKQIAWAEKIRSKILGFAHDQAELWQRQLDNAPDSHGAPGWRESLQADIDAINRLAPQASASWWIDNRNKGSRTLAAELRQQETAKKSSQSLQSLIDTAKANFGDWTELEDVLPTEREHRVGRKTGYSELDQAIETFGLQAVRDAVYVEVEKEVMQ